VSYPKLIHVTCVAHALHRACETVRVLYPNVDKSVANGNEIFVKSPARIELFKAAPRRSILLCNILDCTIILTVWGSY
jgi:hypothetical protein